MPLIYVTKDIDFNMSMNLEIRQQQSCLQFKLCTNRIIQDVNSAVSPDQSMLNFRSTATRLQ